jgi:hypothetical protein
MLFSSIEGMTKNLLRCTSVLCASFFSDIEKFVGQKLFGIYYTEYLKLFSEVTYYYRMIGLERRTVVS